METNRLEFGHERLDCYRLALGVARWAARQAVPTHRKHLRDQLVRAADSIVLNIAEGSGQPPGDARRNHYRIAMGSAAEVAAVIDLVDSVDGAVRKEELRRVAAMLFKMAR
jgi:four helix bundle protein